MKKRIMTMLIAAVMIIMVAAPVVSCASADNDITKVASSFTKEWEKCVYGDNGRAKMIYGYDKTLINEDYVKGYHSSRKHSAGINFRFTSFKNPGKVAKLERIHKEKVVVYSLQY